MCISMPVKVISVDGNSARVCMQNGEEMAVYLAVDAKPGDWILLYAGVGIKIIDEQEAALGMEILKSK